MANETLWDTTPGPRTVWDRDIAGPSTETRWDLLPELLVPSTRVDLLAPLHRIELTAPLHRVVMGNGEGIEMYGCEIITHRQGSTAAVYIDGKYGSDTPRPSINWTGVVDCQGAGITLATSTWTLNSNNPDTALTLDQESIDGLEVSVRVSAGTPGATYGIVNTITTSDSRTFSQELRMTVAELGPAFTH